MICEKQKKTEKLIQNEANLYRSKNKMNNQNRILIFDVETTGLLPKGLDHKVTVEERLNLALYPYIIQFSFILYNLETRAIERKHNFYINVPVDVPDKITEITGITKQMCDERGIPILVALGAHPWRHVQSR